MSGTFQLILFVDRLHESEGGEGGEGGEGLLYILFSAFPELACTGCDECGVTFGVSDRHLYTARLESRIRCPFITFWFLFGH